MLNFTANSHTEDVWTANLCLKRILEIFPDISHKFVLDQWHTTTALIVPGQTTYQTVLDHIVEHPNHPKEQDEQKRLLERLRQDATVDPMTGADLESRTSDPHYQRLGSVILDANRQSPWQILM